MNRAAEKFLRIIRDKDMTFRIEKKLGKMIIKNISDSSFYDAIVKAIEEDSANRDPDDFDFENPALKDLVSQVVFNNEDVQNNMKKFPLDVQKKLASLCYEAVKYVSDELKNDVDFIVDMAEHFPAVYHYMGSELKRNKEFMLSIKDKNPSAFASAFYDGYFEMSEEEVKDFYRSNPNLFQYLPPKYFEDKLFIADVIDSITMTPGNSLLLSFADFDFESLSLSHVKAAMIRKFGYDGYKGFLCSAARKKKEYLRKLPPEYLKEMMFSDGYPMDSDLFEDEEMQKLIAVMNQFDDRFFTSELDNPKKMAKALYEVSSSLGKSIDYNEIFSFVNKNYEQLQTLASRCYDHEAITFLYNVLSGIENKNFDALCVIFDTASIARSPYVANLKNIEITEDNIEFLKIIADTNLLGKSASDIEFYNSFYNKISTIIYDPDLLKMIIQNLDNQENLVHLLKGVDVGSIDRELLINIVNYVQSGFDAYINIDDINKLRDYNKFISDNEQIIPKDKSIVVGRDFLFMKYAGMTLNTAQRYIHFYFSASVDDEIYNKFPEALVLKDLYEKIKNISNIEEMIKIDKELESLGIKTSLSKFVDMSANVKDYFEEEMRSSLSTYTGKGEIYDVSDQDFKMLIHVLGAYGWAGDGTPYQVWNAERKNGSPTICASLISQGNMGTARADDSSVILGFVDLPEDYVEIMSCQDLVSSGLSAVKASRFMNSDELIDNTRHGHNEIVIRRTEEINKGHKVQPSYIICFDRINEESKLAAEEFGIPIVFIDREKVAIRQREKIDSMVIEFEKNPSPELLNRIIVEQENNKAGFHLCRPDLVDKYFNKDYRQENLNKIYSIIKNCSSEDMKRRCMQEFIDSVEKEKEKTDVKEDDKERENHFDLDYEEMVEEFKKSPSYDKDVKVNKYDELLKIGLEKLAMEMERAKDSEKGIERNNENESKRSI